MNKKLIIGGGVLALLGVGYYFYTKSYKNSSVNAKTKLSEIGEDVNQAISVEENLVTDSISDVLTEENSTDTLVDTEPIASTRPITSTRPMEGTATSNSTTTKLVAPKQTTLKTVSKISRYSGFGGKSDFIEVSHILTDLN